MDLIVQQAGRSGGLNSDFGDYFAAKARELPGVTVADGVVISLARMRVLISDSSVRACHRR